MKGMKFVGHVARMGEVNVYNIIVVEVKGLLCRSVCTWKDNTNIGFKEVGCEVFD